jgi:predicted  nucleic acid-binding Zn-ribbon protein
MTKEQLDSLSQVLGHEVTEENFSEALNSFKEIKTKADSVDSLQNEKDSLASEVENLKTQLSEKQSEVEKYQENLRAEVLKFANLALENKVPEATQNLIAKADLETSKALLVQYQEICKEKYKS